MSYCCFLLLPGLYQPTPPPLFIPPPQCFQPKLPFLSWSVSSDVQFSPKSLWLTWSMSVSWDAMAPLSCDEYIFLKNNPHSLDYEPNSNLKFCCWWWWLYIYIFLQFSSALLWQPFCFIVGFHFYGYSFCVLHVVLKHFRENPTVLSSWYPLGLTYSFPVKVAVIENRHGTTHCLNTVDQSRWSQETHPVEKNRPQAGHEQCRLAERSSHPIRPRVSCCFLLFIFPVYEPHLAPSGKVVFGSNASISVWNLTFSSQFKKQKTEVQVSLAVCVCVGQQISTVCMLTKPQLVFHSWVWKGPPHTTPAQYTHCYHHSGAMLRLSHCYLGAGRGRPWRTLVWSVKKRKRKKKSRT